LAKEEEPGEKRKREDDEEGKEHEVKKLNTVGV